MSALDFLNSLVEDTAQRTASSINPTIQRTIEAQVESLVRSLVEAIPSDEELQRLGVELGTEIVEYIQTEVLNEIYYRVGKEADALKGLEMTQETRVALYDKIIQKVPTQKPFNVLGTTIVIDIQSIVKKAINFELFCKIVDRALVFASSVVDTVEPEAVAVAKRVGLAIAFGGVLLGAASMYGFMRLYQSTTDAPFTSHPKRL